MPRFVSRAPRGFGKARLRRARRGRRLTGLVEIHHVVPRQLARHPRLAAERYDVEGPYNTIFMPSNAYPVWTHRPRHTGGHPDYNRFVARALDECPPERECFALLLVLLHAACRGRRAVPWRRGAPSAASASDCA